MYEVYSNGMCLVPSPNGTFTRPKQEQVATVRVWAETITVDGTTSPRRPVEASTLDANKPGHLSEDDYTAGSQPDVMQQVTVTDLAGDVS